MGEYYAAINHTTQEKVYPQEKVIPDDQQLPIKLIDWMNGDASWIIPYLIAVSNDKGLKEYYGELMGSWAGDNISLIGDSARATGNHPEQQDQPNYQHYTDITEKLYNEMASVDDDLPTVAKSLTQ